MKSFWTELPKPIMALAPMANVTDAAFRRVIAKYGKPDVLWTEFVSADGLCHPVARERLLPDLWFTAAERPIVAQLFSAHPDKMFKAAQLIQELKFDGLDINMGCPDRSVEKQGSGAALIKTPKLARELIRAAKNGAPNLPISVKTRLGYKQSALDNWLPELLAEQPAVITIHARTRDEMSKVAARWEEVARAMQIRNSVKSSALIIGNGDLKDLADARAKVAISGADGAMLGRAIFGNPWLFADNQRSDLKEASRSDLKIRLSVLVEHTQLFEELLGQIKSFNLMKKHYKTYLAGFGNKELSLALMNTQNATEVEQIVTDFLKTHISI